LRVLLDRGRLVRADRVGAGARRASARRVRRRARLPARNLHRLRHEAHRRRARRSLDGRHPPRRRALTTWLREKPLNREYLGIDRRKAPAVEFSAALDLTPLVERLIGGTQRRESLER